MSIWTRIDAAFLSKRNIPMPSCLFSDLQSNSMTDMAMYFKSKFSLKESIEEIINEWICEAKYQYEHELKLKPHSFELIKLLKESNCLLAIGTSNESSLTHAVLKQNNVFDYFSVIVTGCTDIKGKPEPDIYLQAAQKLNVLPKECLVIEDTLVGVTAAKRAEMTVFAIADDFSAKERKEIIATADKYFDNYLEIINALRN